MSTDFDNWLNTLNFENSESHENTEQAAVSHGDLPEVHSHLPNETITVPIVQEEAPTEPIPSGDSISSSGFDEILESNGFENEEPEFDSAEEVQEEEGQDLREFHPEDVEDATFGIDIAEEDRDLDAEEDAEWEERISSGEISAVPNPNQEATTEIQNQMTPHLMELADSILSTRDGNTPLIPPNSPTLLVNDATSRFSGAEWYNEIQKARIILAGLGGIGSWVSLQLARMAPDALFMYDDDIVEAANMSGQLYNQNDIGKTKVDAIAGMLRIYTSIRGIYAVPERFTERTEAGDIMICGFDNMGARRTFYNSWVEHVKSKPEEERKNCLLLDGRLSMDTLQVFCLTGDNTWAIDEYRNKYLFTDSQADATVCSMKQTTYLACMIGSIIVNLFTNFIANSLDPTIPYDLPFFTEYDAQNMIFKTIK